MAGSDLAIPGARRGVERRQDGGRREVGAGGRSDRGQRRRAVVAGRGPGRPGNRSDRRRCDPVWRGMGHAGSGGGSDRFEHGGRSIRGLDRGGCGRQRRDLCGRRVFRPRRPRLHHRRDSLSRRDGRVDGGRLRPARPLRNAVSRRAARGRRRARRRRLGGGGRLDGLLSARRRGRRPAPRHRADGSEECAALGAGVPARTGGGPAFGAHGRLRRHSRTSGRRPNFRAGPTGCHPRCRPTNPPVGGAWMPRMSRRLPLHPGLPGGPRAIPRSPRRAPPRTSSRRSATNR